MLIPRQTTSISWSAPADVRAAAVDVNFADYLKAAVRAVAAQPPGHRTPGHAPEGIRRRQRRGILPEEHHLNFSRAVHGGVISAVLDSCIGYAVNAALKPEETFVTTQLNMQFVRGVKAGEATLKAQAELRHRGAPKWGRL
jgi:acyl-coenzyme A thioesterase PaaI-like protein